MEHFPRGYTGGNNSAKSSSPTWQADHRSDECALQFFSTFPSTPKLTAGRKMESTLRICILWNKGRCSFPKCTFRYICATCFRYHMAKDCTETPPESDYKRTRFPMQGRSGKGCLPLVQEEKSMHDCYPNIFLNLSLSQYKVSCYYLWHSRRKSTYWR